MEEYADDLLRLQPVIIAMWHGQFVMLPILTRLGVKSKAMVAIHRDAEGLARALASFGIELIRGAGSGSRKRDRGGANAFRASASALDEGFSVAMTADVPPGPARRCGHGIITLAKVTGRPILPVAMASSRFVAFNNWSRMTLNLPFSQLGASFGTPVYVPKDASPEELERLRIEVETQLNIATVDAYARAGVSHLKATPPSALSAAGERARPGRLLKAYRQATRALAGAAPLLLRVRERVGKEQPERRSERLGLASAKRPEGRLIWLHAANVGETNTIVPLMKELKREAGDVNLLLTTGTVTSARLATSRLSAIAKHQYVPLDVPQYALRFLDHWRPDLAIFAESELWPNLIAACAGRQIPMVLVNARMSRNSFRRWRRYGSVARPLLSSFRLILAQTREFADRFIELGGTGVRVCGNLKADSPLLIVEEEKRSELAAVLGGRHVLLATSTHEAEEVIVARAHERLRRDLPDLVTFIAPRHPERGTAIADTLLKAGFRVRRRSQGELPDVADGSLKAGIYLADTSGELGTLFSLAPVTFMGKSLSIEAGGHNPIEAVRGGSAVLTGPGWRNFQESYKALLQTGGGIEVKDAESLALAARSLLEDEEKRQLMTAAADKAMEPLSGALARTVAAVLEVLPSARGSADRETADAH